MVSCDVHARRQNKRGEKLSLSLDGSLAHMVIAATHLSDAAAAPPLCLATREQK